MRHRFECIHVAFLVSSGNSAKNRPMNSVRLMTPRVILREITANDWRGAQVLDSDPEVVRYQTHGLLDEAGTKAVLERAISSASTVPRTTYDLAVCFPGDEGYIGRAGLGISRPEHREASVWFHLRRDLWGRGLASEVLVTLLDFAFGELGIHRVFGDCDPRNLRSARLMERVGMVREAHFRENYWVKGEWCGAFIYAVLEQDWRALRAQTAKAH
jgi:[ribosomal protein S5]-alanine N-acetyltransferase